MCGCQCIGTVMISTLHVALSDPALLQPNYDTLRIAGGGQQHGDTRVDWRFQGHYAHLRDRRATLSPHYIGHRLGLCAHAKLPGVSAARSAGCR